MMKQVSKFGYYNTKNCDFFIAKSGKVARMK